MAREIGALLYITALLFLYLSFPPLHCFISLDLVFSVRTQHVRLRFSRRVCHVLYLSVFSVGASYYSSPLLANSASRDLRLRTFPLSSSQPAICFAPSFPALYSTTVLSTTATTSLIPSLKSQSICPPWRGRIYPPPDLLPRCSCFAAACVWSTWLGHGVAFAFYPGYFVFPLSVHTCHCSRLEAVFLGRFGTR